MSKTIAIVQSSYIPWKGYFDLINMVDEFVLFDDVQFTKRDWRSRNAIKTAQGPLWLSVPCATKGRYEQLICETEISDQSWAGKHWKSIAHAYARAPHFSAFAPALEAAYAKAGALTLLSDVNRVMLETLCAMLGVTTPLTDSRDYGGTGAKTDRLLSLCRAAGATRYISGPSAQAYIENDKFEAAGVELAYVDYSGYREYPQPHPPFVHAVSVIDLLFNLGPDAPQFMKSFNAS
jgi:hypothetical protein